jgi:hypothetical protein
MSLKWIYKPEPEEEVVDTEKEDGEVVFPEDK